MIPWALSECFLLFLALTGLATSSPSDGPERPRITGVAPDTAITTPGSIVAIHGSGFARDAVVYIGGLQVRKSNFISSTAIEVVIPYLRPGNYSVQIKSEDTTVHLDGAFTALPSEVDSDIDRAVTLASHGKTSTAIDILDNIAATNTDYQVRSFAHYQTSQIYFALGDWWRWRGEAAYIFAEESGMAVQTCWQYRVVAEQSTQFLSLTA